MDLRILDDDSEIGGEGGVAVAEANVSLVGVVLTELNIGDEMMDVPGDRSNISGVCGVDGLRYKGVGLLIRRPVVISAFRSFS